MHGTRPPFHGHLKSAARRAFGGIIGNGKSRFGNGLE
jgi:hypothetical protein